MKISAALFAFLGLCALAVGKTETWTNTDGKSMEAELVGADAKFASFKKADGGGYLYPLEKLASADQARVQEFIAQNPTATPAAAAPAPVMAGKLTSEIVGKLVSVRGKSLAPVSRETVLGAKYYAIYFSAHWCPPCRGFTPELVDAYSELKAKNPDFEVIFVSNDETKDDMQGYMTEYKMPWPAIRFDATKSIPAIQRFRGNGIPNLLFVTADGEILSSSYVGEKYVGPRKVLFDIQQKLGGKS
ncbi:MAG: thioredoxin-like domain-containing protein [Opitutaceae bacterium]|jgi:nucleoredoxin